MEIRLRICYNIYIYISFRRFVSSGKKVLIMKLKFEEAELEIVLFDRVDVIEDSGPIISV